MKKKTLITLLLTMLLFLVACEEEKEEVLREETYTVENIKFKRGSLLKYNTAIIETNQESLVVSNYNLVFIKSNESESTIHAKWIKDDSDIDEHIEATVYISESDVKEISRAYTNEYEITMEFETETGEKK